MLCAASQILNKEFMGDLDLCAGEPLQMLGHLQGCWGKSRIWKVKKHQETLTFFGVRAGAHSIRAATEH